MSLTTPLTSGSPPPSDTPVGSLDSTDSRVSVGRKALEESFSSTPSSYGVQYTPFDTTIGSFSGHLPHLMSNPHPPTNQPTPSHLTQSLRGRTRQNSFAPQDDNSDDELGTGIIKRAPDSTSNEPITLAASIVTKDTDGIEAAAMSLQAWVDEEEPPEEPQPQQPIQQKEVVVVEEEEADAEYESLNLTNEKGGCCTGCCHQ